MPTTRRRLLQGLLAATLPRLAPAHGTESAAPLIANGWPAHASLLIMLGAGHRIAATVNSPSTKGWMYRVQPSLHRALYAPKGGLTAERLLARGITLAFLNPGDTSAAALKAAGIRVERVGFQSFAGLRECVLQTAAVLGGSAPLRARSYLEHFDRELKEIQQWSAPFAEAARPRVLHVVRWAPQLVIDGQRTIIDEWIRAAGGLGAVQDFEGTLRLVDSEYLLRLDPDIIIQSAESARHTARPAGFDALRAVREQRVYTNPEGVFPWDRYGCEITLQLRWAASVLHPDKMPADDLPQRVQDFYRRFYGYPGLTLQDAQRIIAGLPPA